MTNADISIPFARHLLLIGDDSNWPPSKGREKTFVDGTINISQCYAVEMQCLDFASQRYDTNADAKEKVAHAIRKIKPDIEFY